MGDISLDGKLVETAYLRSEIVNEFGDRVYQTQGAGVACLYRDISTFSRAQNRVDITLDGILWFDAGTDVERGQVWYHPDEGYLQIERVTRAKRLLTDNTVQFIRCEVTKQRQVS